MPTRDQEARQLLLKALQSTALSQLPCVFVMLGWLKDIVTNDKTSAPSIRARLFDASFRWVTRPQTQTHMRAFLSRSCECSLIENNKMQAWHDLGIQSHQEDIGDDAEPQWDLVSTLVMGLSAGFVTETVVGERFRLHKLRNRPNWPSNVAHLLPHGAEDTIRGLLSWLSLQPTPAASHHLYTVILCLVRTCEPSVLSFVVTSHTWLRHSISRLEAINHQLRVNDVTVTEDTSPSSTSSSMFNIATTLHQLLVIHMDQVQMCYAVMGHHEQLITGLRQCRDACNLSKPRSDIRGMDHMKMAFDRSMDLLDHMISYIPISLSSPSASTYPMFQPFIVKIHVPTMVKRVLQSDHCSAPGCRITFFDCGPLSYCSGC
jgi:hypothetical protein